MDIIQDCIQKLEARQPKDVEKRDKDIDVAIELMKELQTLYMKGNLLK